MTTREEELLAEIRRLTAQVEAHQQEQGWQDIESAPTNQRVLVFIPEVGNKAHGVFAGVRVRLTGRWMLPAGGGSLWTPPTRWKPLPSPPRASSGTQETL